MDDASATPRTALLAGATGLVGSALLSLLLASKHYRSVHVLLRRAAPDIKVSPKLKVHHVDFAMLPAAFPTVDDVFITLGTTIKVAGSTGAQSRSVGGAASRANELDDTEGDAADPRPRRGVGIADRHSHREARRSGPEIGSHASARPSLARSVAATETRRTPGRLSSSGCTCRRSWNRATVACRPVAACCAVEKRTFAEFTVRPGAAAGYPTHKAGGRWGGRANGEVPLA
jgi:hypothetical protein